MQYDIYNIYPICTRREAHCNMCRVIEDVDRSFAVMPTACHTSTPPTTELTRIATVMRDDETKRLTPEENEFL